MAELMTTKQRVILAGVTGNGQKFKKIVTNMVGLHNDLSIASVHADDADNYVAYISYKGQTDWVIMATLTNSASYGYFRYMIKNPDGTYMRYDTMTADVSFTYDTLIVEATFSGSDMLIVSVTTDSGSIYGTLVFLSIIDQFTNAEKTAVTMSGSGGLYFQYEALYMVDGVYVTKVEYDKNANGLTPNEIPTAIPVVFYTKSEGAPLSGFLGGKPLLYRIYQGTREVYFDSRLKNFTLGGHSFTTISRDFCFRTS